MAFEPGKSGNPAGRPKQADLEAVDLSILRALRKVIRRNPRLIEEAIQRRLEARDNFGMIEMIAKLTRELGNKEEERTQIAIVFNGGLDPNKLRMIDAKVVSAMPNPSNGQSSLPRETDQEVLQSNLQDEVREPTELSKEPEEV